MDAGYSHEIQVGANAREAFDRRRGHRYYGGLEQSATDEHDLDRRMLDQGNRDRRTVSDDRGLQVGRQMPGELQGRSDAVEYHYSPRPNQLPHRSPDRQ